MSDWKNKLFFGDNLHSIVCIQRRKGGKASTWPRTFAVLPLSEISGH